MEFKVKAGGILKEKTDAAVIFAFEGDKLNGILAEADKALGGVISEAIKSGEFSGKRDQAVCFNTIGAGGIVPKRIIAAGLGKKDGFKADNLMRAAGSASKLARKLSLKDIAVMSDPVGKLSAAQAADLITQGASLSLYTFDKFKAPDPDKKEIKKITLVVSDKALETQAKEGLASGLALSEAVLFTRDMVNAPANKMTPADVAEQAKKTSKAFGLKLKVLDEKDCAKLGMGSFLGVAQGSEQPAKFIVLEYKGGKKADKPVVIVGKAITFDSGGISLKPTEGMEKMKYDMAGGAAVIGAVRAAAALKLPVNLVCIVPACENLPSGRAAKPGDVLTAMNGKTIEIISTDAEGRLVLADALVYAYKNYDPKAVIDIATLTGACVIALGDLAIGLMSTDDKLAKDVLKAGDAVQ
ncbi:MAG TPA: leucyl aminopeptidase, partial [Nitrospirota bacterium]